MIKWIKKLLLKEPKSTQEFALTNKQFASLQRLSNYYQHQQEEIKGAFPEIHSELKFFFDEGGKGWGWFPRGNVLDPELLKGKVERNPSFFEIEGEVTGPKDGTLFYSFQGYAAVTDENKVVRRGKVSVERIEENFNDEEFLDELSRI